MKIAVVGGDKRMLFAARAFADSGCEVCIAGFDDLVSLCEIRVNNPVEAVKWADAIILPVRPVSDGCLNAPYLFEPVMMNTLLDAVGEKPIFSGFSESILPYANGRVYDYSAEEDFTWRNASLTVEGALGVLLNDYEGSIRGCRILVTGYGRIGKLLCRALNGLGADVIIAARKQSDRSLAALSGCDTVAFPLTDCSSYSVIINTVPALAFDHAAVDTMRGDVFIIDLASMPGGVDFDRVRERGLTVMHCLGLPAATAPLEAGRIIRDTVINIMSREGISDDCPSEP